VGADLDSSDAARSEAIASAAVDLTVDLVRVDTVNPGLVPCAVGEAVAVDLLRRRLGAAGFECVVVTPSPGRPSLVAHRGRATGGRPCLLLNGHLDTVGTGAMPAPFSAAIAGDRATGRLMGRGACDMKAGIAGLVVAAEAVAAADPQACVWLALVADEEDASLGTEAVIGWLAERGMRPDACLVAEPTWLDLAAAHRGFAVVEVELRGRAAHSSRPAEGVNAVAHLGRLLHAVEAYDAELATREPHPVAGVGSLMATVAAGGLAPFSLPDRARAMIERRCVPGEPAAIAVREVEDIIAVLRAGDPAVDATVRPVLTREAWELDGSAASERLAGLMSGHLVRAGSPEPRRIGAPYWMESALWQQAGIPAIVCGPAGGGLHADDEWVDLAQVRCFAVALTGAAAEFCS
jgi:acetylornithine deacetylase